MTGDSRPWWWLSHADPNKPKGEHFQGACIVRGAHLEGAIAGAKLLGISPPGCEVLGLRIPDALLPPAEERERLLNREEAAFVTAVIEQGSRSMGVSGPRPRMGRS